MSKHPYVRHTSEESTPQSEPLPGQVPNSAGGHAFAVDKWTQFRRFLILGSEGGTYYIDERKLTRDNAKSAQACIDEDGARAVELITQVSNEGLAAKNDPALFALALAAKSSNPATRQLALDHLGLVARIGTHLFQFVEFAGGISGRKFRKAIRNWYAAKGADGMALQIVKYPSRNGWSHRDVLRLAHAKFDLEMQNAAARFAVKGAEA